MKKSIIIAILIILIVITWFLSGHFFNDKEFNNKDNIDKISNDNQSKNNSNNIKVETKILLSKEIEQSIILQGQTIANRTIDVKAETTGNIIKKNFKRGKIVKTNELLVKLSMEDRMEILESYNKELELYKIEYETTKKLINKGLSSKSNLNQASLNLAKVNSKIKNIEIDIENTKIKAPFNGIIENSLIEIGDYVRPGDELFNIIDLNPIKIRGYLSETDVNKVKLGTKATIMIANSISKDGKITFISPIGESETRTFEFTVEANNDDLLFKSGLTATITINVDAVKAHKISPSILSLQDNGSIGVKAVDNNNKVVFYSVNKVKDTIDGMWVTGLPEKVKLIITGQEYITEGKIVDFD